MVDTNKELLLARPLREVKKLSSSVTLESYYKHIKPFLFGTNSTDLVNLESVTSGVYALASDGKLTPGKDIFIEIAGAGNKFKTIDIKKNKTVLDFQSKKERTSEYFLPSDFVSILTALARIFYSGSTVGTAAYRYNEDGLSDYAATATSQGDISFVKKWGEAGVEQIIPPAKPGETPAISPEENINWFYEYKLVDKNVSKVEKLLQEVAKAALEFEKLKQPLNTNDFKAKSEIEKLLLVDIQQKIIDDFEAYNSKVKPKISTEPKFAEASKKILGKIEELIKSKSADLVYSLFSLENTKIFTDKKIFSPERQTALWEARDEDALLGISLSDEYSTFLETETKNFLDRYKTDLEKDYIDPLFVESEEETAEAGEKSEDDTESGDAASSQEEITEILSEDKLKEKIEENLSESIYKLFVEKYIYEDSGRKQLFEPQKDNFENQYLEPLTEQLEKTIYEKVTNNFKFEANILEELEKENLYKEEVFSEKLLESEIYKDFIKNRTQFISEISSPDSNYGSYFEFLYNQFVVPALDLLYDSPTPPDSDESAADTDTADSDESERISSASVPTDISTPIPVPQVGETTFVSGDISTLSPEQLRSLQYESAWMYNRAIYELFTVHGLSESDLDPVLLAKMNAEIFDFIAGMDEKSLNLMFGSASQRQKALLQFYQKFNQTNNLNEYYDKLKETDAWQKLTSKQQEGLAATTNRLLVNKTIFTTEDLLQISLREALEIDSPVLNQNIKNSIDALIIKHGINQTFYAYNQDTKEVISYKAGSDKDALWEIENMPDGRLALIFNLPSDTRFTDKKVLKLLKETLKKYAKHRASDLALHIKATSLAEGFVHIGADLETVRATIKKFGAKTVAGGFDEKSAVLDEEGKKIKDGSNRKELIKKQYASFIPLWNHLTPQEQALIYYESLGYVPKDNPDYGITGYPFIPEFLFFDLSRLSTIKRIAQEKNLSERKKQELYELLALNEQLAKEEAFANYLKELYQYNADVSEAAELAALAGLSAAALNRATSYRELTDYDQEIQSGGSSQYDPVSNRKGLIPKFLNSKYGKKLKNKFSLKKKLSPAEKSKKALNSAASGALTKAVAAGSNLVVPGLGAALMAIPNKKLRDGIAKAIAFGLSLLISSTIYALGSIGGMIGGIIGGILGGVLSGGTMIIPGVIAGAHIGNFILPQRWTGLLWGGKNAPAVLPQTVSISGALPASAAQTILTAAPAVVAPLASTTLVVVITLYVILVIQSAFLIPVPNERTGVAFDPNNPIGAIGFENCENAGVLSDKIDRNSSSDLAGRAFDIVNTLQPGFWCYWNWNPNYDGLSADFTTVDSSERPDLFDEVEFTQYPNHCVYRDGFPTGCGGDWKAMDGDVLYWCTWLVNHTYQQNYSLAARIMADQFRTLSGHIFMPVETVTYNDIQPGDVIFTSTSGRNGNIGHVAIVHDVGPDYIRSVDSNASSRYHEFAVGDDGKVIVDSISYLGVVGFGRRL